VSALAVKVCLNNILIIHARKVGINSWAWLLAPQKEKTEEECNCCLLTWMGSSETGCNIRSQWLQYTQNALAALSDICNILSRYSMWPECLRWRNLRPSTTIYMYNGRSQLFCLSNDLFVVTSGSSELSVIRFIGTNYIVLSPEMCQSSLKLSLFI
jgi:hypothetical protein